MQGAVKQRRQEVLSDRNYWYQDNLEQYVRHWSLNIAMSMDICYTTNLHRGELFKGLNEVSHYFPPAAQSCRKPRYYVLMFSYIRIRFDRIFL